MTPVALLTAALFFTASYGLSDEIHQLFTPGRNFEFADILADALGGVAGCASFVVFNYWRDRRYRRQ